jgi:hypothetical protein
MIVSQVSGLPKDLHLTGTSFIETRNELLPVETVRPEPHGLGRRHGPSDGICLVSARHASAEDRSHSGAFDTRAQSTPFCRRQRQRTCNARGTTECTFSRASRRVPSALLLNFPTMPIPQAVAAHDREQPRVAGASVRSSNHDGAQRVRRRIEGARECDIAAIRRAMGFQPAEPVGLPHTSRATRAGTATEPLPFFSPPSLLTGLDAKPGRVTITIRLDAGALIIVDSAAGAGVRPALKEGAPAGRSQTAPATDREIGSGKVPAS